MIVTSCFYHAEISVIILRTISFSKLGKRVAICYAIESNAIFIALKEIFMRNDQHGFTLVELIIVSAVIGILAAIAIPQFTKYKSHAVQSRMESDLNTCMKTAAANAAENSSQTQNCSVLGSNILDCTVTVHQQNGSLSLSPCTFSFQTFNITCTIQNNTGACQL